jgi:formylglycine-generating enzyme required for sulfatase activity
MSKQEITRKQFAAIMGDDPSNTTYSSGTKDPVQMVNWYHAIAFCNKLSIAEGLEQVYSVSGVDFSNLAFGSIPTSLNTTWNGATADWTANGYRLPTEMEWMWAAMGAVDDNTKPFAGSGGSNVIGDYAWYSDNSSNKTHPVGTKLPNELGLYDMSGNVWEWTWDRYAVYPDGTLTDYQGAASGTHRVLRGGGWGGGASYCTVANRVSNYPHDQNNVIGFRVVRP